MIFVKSVDIRGDTDESRQRGLDRAMSVGMMVGPPKADHP
jgi:hypothetical protein